MAKSAGEASEKEMLKNLEMNKVKIIRINAIAAHTISYVSGVSQMTVIVFNPQQ